MIDDAFERKITLEIDQLSKLNASFLPGELIVSGKNGTGLWADVNKEIRSMHKIANGVIMIVVVQQGAMILVVTGDGLVGWTMLGWVDSL